MHRENVARMQLELYKKARKNRKKRFSGLMELLTDDAVLDLAWSNVCKGTKAAGSDSLSVGDIKARGVWNFLESIKGELKGGTYQADSVLFFEIPKSNGSMRKIGIFTVKDRLVQAGMKLILEPIFEADFTTCSFGFRAYRSPRLASLEVYKWLCSGNKYVFKGDILDCFNNISHGRLMKLLKQRIDDRSILSIIKSWLKAEHIGDCNRTLYKGKGIIPGSIISPLFMNIYLNQFDNEWEYIGLKSINLDLKGHLVRYADDFVILSQNMLDQQYVRDTLDRIGLVLNEDKIIVSSSAKGFEFLGFYFIEAFPDDKYRSSVSIYPSNYSVRKVMDNIDSLTQATPDDMVSSIVVVQKMNELVDSWLHYYHHTDYAKGLEAIQECYDKRLQYYMQDCAVIQNCTCGTKVGYQDYNRCSPALLD